MAPSYKLMESTPKASAPPPPLSGSPPKDGTTPKPWTAPEVERLISIKQDSVKRYNWSYIAKLFQRDEDDVRAKWIQVKPSKPKRSTSSKEQTKEAKKSSKRAKR